MRALLGRLGQSAAALLGNLAPGSAVLNVSDAVVLNTSDEAITAV